MKVKLSHIRKPKKNACGRESDFQQSRPWWEPPYVIYGSSDPHVRSRMETLMGYYIAPITDHKYMLRLQQRMREVHQEMVYKRIHDRELEEVEREKRLILEGKMSVEEAPQGLSDQPVFRITELVKEILEKRRRKDGKKKRPKNLKRFNYDLLKPREEIDIGELSGCTEQYDSEAERGRKLEDRELYLRDQQDFTNEDYERIKYSDPLVEELRQVETVDELYELADEIVGLLIGKKCGGLVKQT